MRLWLGSAAAVFLLSTRCAAGFGGRIGVRAAANKSTQISRAMSVQGVAASDDPEAAGRGSLSPPSAPVAALGADSAPLAPWLERIAKSITKSRRIKGGNYVQIATVDSAGLPHCRTVVHRGFLKGTARGTLLKMITDARSDKVTQIRAGGGQCEMVWWFSESSEQYRIRGSLLLGGEGPPPESAEFAAPRLEAWKGLSDPAREQFFWPAPGPFDASAPPPPPGGRDEHGVILPPPPNFLLLLLAPTQVKYLRLRDNLAILDELVMAGPDERWAASRINP